MKPRKKNLLRLSILFISPLIFIKSFAQDAIGIVGPNNESRTENETEKNIIVVPEEAKNRYKFGEAPFYIKLNNYGMRIFSEGDNGGEYLRGIEASTLGVSDMDVEKISQILRKFNAKDQAAIKQSKINACMPVIKDGVDLQAAKATLIRLGDKSVNSNAIAESLMDEVATTLGEGVAIRLRDRIDETGGNIVFTKVDIQNLVELKFDGDYQKYLIDECSSL